MLNSKTIGNKIATARKRINLSQAELAQQVLISSQAVGKWERGESMPDITTLNRLAEILGVDLNYFSENFQSVDAETTTAESFNKQSVELPSSKQKKRLSWDMSQGNWVDADFSGLKNLQEKFGFSNIKHCQFIGSEMAGFLLNSNNIENCDFSSSDISNSKIKTSSLSKNLFKDCLLKNAEFSDSHIIGCDFTRADFTGVIVKSSSFIKNILVNTLWNNTSFNVTGFDNVVFAGLMENCSFENCGFAKVKFENATLINTFFKNNKKLKQVQFIDCKVDKITYAFLQNGKADLTGITLLTA